MSGDADPALGRRLDHLAARLEALAHDQRHLRHLLFALADVRDAAAGGPAPPPPDPDEPADRGRAWRAGRFVLRRTLGVARRAWQTSDPDRADRPRVTTAPSATAAPTLAAVVAADDAAEITPRLAAQTLPPTWLAWDREADRAAIHAAADFLVPLGPALGAPDLATAPATLFELVRLALAAEDLLFLELPAGPADTPLLVLRSDLWRPPAGDDGAGWDDAALRRALRGRRRRVVGRVVAPPGGGAAWRHRPAGGPPLRLVESRVVATRGHGPVRHRVAALAEVALPADGVAGVARVAAGRLLVVLPRGPYAGADRLAAEAARRAAAGGAEVAVVSLVSSDAVAARRLEVLAATATVYPAGDVLPAEVAATAVPALARRRAATRVVDLGDRAALPPLTVAVPAAPAPDGERRAHLRTVLGLPAAALVVAWRGDLVAALRPEDFVALAARARDDAGLAFLLAGQGPLAGTVGDLATLLAPPRLVTTADLAVADLALATGEDDPLPYPTLEAMAAGLPAVVTAGSVLASELAALDPGLVVPVGDPAAALVAVGRLRDADLRRRLGAACRELVTARYVAGGAAK